LLVGQSLFAVPKAFDGHAGRIQRNALATWRSLPGVEILLLGGEKGVAAAAAASGAAHIPEIERTPSGAPRLDDVFRRAEARASSNALLYVNGDILLPENVVDCVEVVRRVLPDALCVGQCLNVDVAGDMDRFDPDLERSGVLRGVGGIDYLAFRRGTFPALPPFALGRAFYDNWLIWNARRRGIPVVDLTEVVHALHQNHDYDHLAGGRRSAYSGDDARRNLELAGGRLHLFNIDDATHRLTKTGRLRRNRLAPFRAAPPLRLAALLIGRLERRILRAPRTLEAM
jgi:hypothetical protein